MNCRRILCLSNFCFLPEGKIWFDWFCILRVKRTYGTQFILGESAWGKTLISVSDEKLPFCFNFFLNMSYMGIHRNYYQQPIGIITSKWGIKKYTGRWLLFLLWNILGGANYKRGPNYTGYTVLHNHTFPGKNCVPDALSEIVEKIWEWSNKLLRHSIALQTHFVREKRKSRGWWRIESWYCRPGYGYPVVLS